MTLNYIWTLAQGSVEYDSAITPWSALTRSGENS